MSDSPDERPALWVGHVSLPVRDVKESTDYWVNLGMRHIAGGDRFSVLELRGGTHLVLAASEEPIEPGTPCPFDVMVDDIEAARKGYAEAGLAPSEMTVGRIHSSFTVSDPSGYAVTVNSSHVGDRPV